MSARSAAGRRTPTSRAACPMRPGAADSASGVEEKRRPVVLAEDARRWRALAAAGTEIVLVGVPIAAARSSIAARSVRQEIGDTKSRRRRGYASVAWSPLD